MQRWGMILKDGRWVRENSVSKENQEKFREGTFKTKTNMVKTRMSNSKMSKLQDFGSAFNFRTNNEKNQSNINRFFGQKGRVINLKKSQEEDRVKWEENFLKRSDEYLNNDNQHLTKYEKLKRANQRMKNNLNETRATLEKRKGCN